MVEMSEFEVKVSAYDPIIVDVPFASGGIIGMVVSQDDHVIALELWPEESKKLRKALKKAEQIAGWD